MSQQGLVWLDVLSQTLRRMSNSIRTGGVSVDAGRRPDFKRICDEVEASLSRAGVRLDHAEWQATKSIMKSIYQKTRSAEKNGYDFFQYALTPYLPDTTLSTYLESPRIQRAVEMWCTTLGWRRASIVNWTSVEAAIASVTTSRYPFMANQFAVRLEGLGKQGTSISRVERPTIRPTTIPGTGFGG